MNPVQVPLSLIKLIKKQFVRLFVEEARANFASISWGPR